MSFYTYAPPLAAEASEILHRAVETAGSGADLARALRYDRNQRERLYRALRGDTQRVGHDLVADAKKYLAEREPVASPPEAAPREPLAMEGADPDDWQGDPPEAPLPSGVLFEIRGPQGVIYRLTIQTEQVGEPLRTYARAAETA